MKISILLLILSASAFSQTIRWDGANPCCRNIVSDGMLITTYEDNDVSLTVGLITDIDEKYIFALVFVENRSDNAFTIYPEKFKMQMTGRQPDYAMHADDVAREVEKRGKLSRGFRTFLAGLARRPVATVDSRSSGTIRMGDTRGNSASGTYEGQTRSVITAPDEEARERARVKNAEEKAKNETFGSLIRAQALRANTVFPGTFVNGTTYFKPEKRTPGMILTIPIEGKIIEIPYGAERKK